MAEETRAAPVTPPATAHTSNPAPDAPGRGRVAIIAVHGIADQRRADTGQCAAVQLAAAGGGSAAAHDLPLTVPPLDPAVPYERWQPDDLQGRGRKSLWQSWRSDFLDEAIGGRPGSGARANSAAYSAAGAQADVGVRYTDYLLAKAQGARDDRGAAPGGGDETVNIAVAAVDAPSLRADVYEMYWADLSRLPGSVMRVVTELFTLVFNLSRLGVDTLSLAETVNDEATRATKQPNELRGVAVAQRAADWMFSRVLALLALQLVMVALVLAPAMLVFGHASATQAVAAVLAGVGSAALLVYRRHWPWRGAIAAGAAIGVAVWWFVGTAWGLAGVMLVWLGLLWLVYLRFLAYCEQRFRAVYGIGIVLFAATLACVVLFGRTAGFSAQAGWLAGSLGALEAVLLAHALLWPVQALLVAATVGLSEWALWRGDRAGRDHRQTLVTARLGLFSSVGIFLVCLMIGFVLAATALSGLVGTAAYEPWWFRGGGPVTAAQFLDVRAAQHAASFSLVALLLLGLLGFVALVFAPSIAAELRLATFGSATRLGRWLTAGYRAIERLVRAWGIAVGIGAVIVALAVLWAQCVRMGLLPDLPGVDARLAALLELTRGWSTNWMDGVMYALAGSAAGLIALSQVAIKRLKALRAPLDAALDVDNHFREFPRDAISRVRIVERYVALLDHVRRQGHEHVVIYAHSQGTVITAELLRYLQQRDRLAPPPAPAGQVDLAALRDWLDRCGVHLLTVGSPLRQLYALRFPSMYPWVVDPTVRHADGEKWRGPEPHTLGLRRWHNLWGSGDYVGRWLWSRADDGRPVPLQFGDDGYDAGAQRGTDGQGREWRDECIGADAHTHYFELEQRAVARVLSELAG